MATTYTQRQYAESDAVKKLREQMGAQTAARPADYTSKWQDQVDAAAQNILNRKEFSYDVNGDAMWNQYKDRFTTLGKQAMQDTMGQAAALTGGYGNSNAQIAGQQVYQGYMQGLTDKIPELAQLALDRYNQQGQQLYDQYNLLNTQEQNAYNQWLQNYNLWNDERNYLAGRFDTERGYDYGQYRDAVSDDQWKAKFDEDLRQFNFKNKLGEFAKKKSSSGGGGSTYNPNTKGDGQWAVGIDSTRNQSGLKGSSWDYTKTNLSQLANSGNTAAVTKYMDQVSGQMNESQFKQAMEIINKKK